MSKLLIKGGRIIDPANGLDAVCDLLCEDGKIAEISENISCSDAEIINAEGKIVAPGLVDMHTHLRDPGFTYKEDIATGTRSAAAGGITSVACMPNTNPVADNEAVITYIKNKAEKEAVVNVFPIGSITKGLKGDELSEMGKLKAAGAVAVSDDGKPVENSAIMRRALEYADMFDLKVISHCEIKSLAEGSMNDGETATFLGLKGIPNSAEEIMVSRDVILAEELGVPVHIAHVSTKGSIEIVRNAKKRGVKVTCETCPHYFSLTEKAVLGFNTNAKMNPPLRTDIDLEAVCKGLADGTIDAIATDHAPHHIDEKNCEFVQAMNGIVGFETSLAVSYTYLVKKGILSLPEMISAMAVKPSAILGIDKGTLSVGADADIVVFDTENEFEVCSEKLFSKSKNTPYDKYRLYGRVEATVVGGKIVFDGKEITA